MTAWIAYLTARTDNRPMFSTGRDKALAYIAAHGLRLVR